MQPYVVIIPKQAGKLLGKLPRDVLTRIYGKLEQLGDDPRPSWAKPLKGTSGWRFRVGDYRVLYGIADDRRTVTVRDAGHRREIYRKLKRRKE